MLCPGINPGSYRYRLWLNDQPVGAGEVILREKQGWERAETVQFLDQAYMTMVL